MSRTGRRGRSVRMVVLAMLLSMPSCVLPPIGSLSHRARPLRISELVNVGDPARRASLRLVVNGLEADAMEDRDKALSSYEQAIRVDAANPYAYLAIARHHAESYDPGWALSFLDKADSLFRAQGGIPPSVEPHLVGLRGQALYASGRVEEGAPLLEQAWELAPDVWTDGQLIAEELL